MRLRQGKMAKDKAQVWTQLPLDFFHDGIGKAAIGTFIVTVLNQRHSGGERPLSVIAFAHGYCEMRHLDGFRIQRLYLMNLLLSLLGLLAMCDNVALF
jgi:hypothetical protein